MKKFVVQLVDVNNSVVREREFEIRQNAVTVEKRWERLFPKNEIRLIVRAI